MTKDEAIAVRVRQLRGAPVTPEEVQEAILVIQTSKLTASGKTPKAKRPISLSPDERETANARLLFNLGRACRGVAA